MSTLPFKLLIGLSSLLLLHSCYSAHEHSTVHPSSNELPLDITLETILSVTLLCVGIVGGGWELKPISWRVWSGQLEREKGSGPYGFLEERLGFLDIRAKREEFARWKETVEAE
ncbi:hypothetical protein RUND412_001854 [Rhizina undulata]